MDNLMRTLALILIAAGVASAQCYQFSAPGVSYSMNVQSVQSSQMPLSYLNQFIVKQQSTLTVGGKTYTSTPGPADLNFSSVPGASTMNTFFVDTVDPPTWGVDIILSGTLTFFPTSLPASIPAIGLWNLGTPQMAVTIGGGAVVNYTITAIGSCAASGTGGSGVPGQSLGDASSQDGCPFCGQPITIGTGNMFEEADDYHTAGANRLSFHRYYNSMAASTTFATSLGKNWRSNYDRYLDISASSVVAERPDGRQVTFTPSGGVWTTDADIDMTLTNSGSAWTLTDHMDTVETYNAVSATQGLLQTVKSRNGYTQTMQYGSGNQLTAVTDTYGRQLSLSYNNALLGTVSTPDGLVLSYGFSTNGILTTAGYSTTPATLKTYVYENSSFPAALTGIIDENGTRFATWTYDSTGRALTSQHSGGADLITVAYNDSDGSRTVTGPLGQQGVYHFSTIQSVPKVTEIDFNATSTTPASKTTFTYDGNGYLSSRTDWNGNVTNVVNNSRGLPTSITEASGTPQARTTSISYHPTFRLPVQIVRPNVTASFTYDTGGEMLTFTLTDTTTTSVPFPPPGKAARGHLHGRIRCSRLRRGRGPTCPPC
jgi:YD repeat-containing protein